MSIYKFFQNRFVKDVTTVNDSIRVYEIFGVKYHKVEDVEEAWKEIKQVIKHEALDEQTTSKLITELQQRVSELETKYEGKPNTSRGF